ncbi:DUF1501 domain-containing protein [Zavarzinella formosa]|uniref:DUF1501 domain-containing protein n=1 Tax=Zavarzinella formosa TaxID=360055 RepID=UPI0002ED56B0|nr:DUF1501 domain-containing protein [Zavarzinella formosa]
MLMMGSQTISRRGVLQVGASSVLGLSLSDLLRQRAEGSSPGTAKSVVLLWLWGGPSQLDTFDPKPNAPLEFRGPFGTIPTKIPGVRFCELFPQIAAVSDKLAVIRSLNTTSNDHGIAGTIGLTGSGAGGKGLDGQPLPGAPRPATGSVVARVLTATGARKASKEQLPPFLVVGGKLHQGKKPIIGEGGGPLGNTYDPFRLEYDPIHGTKVPALQLETDLTPDRLGDRQALMKSLDVAERNVDRARQTTGALDQYRSQAFAMLTSSKAREMFDLEREPVKLRDEYGRTRFGQSCVLARRLVEHGVPFVQVNWSDHVEAEEDAGDGGWDHHYRNFQIMQDRHAIWLDRTVSAFLRDLEIRGLLKTTLVLAVGEFGRTPKINDKAGREHHPNCYSALAFGGGVIGGRVIGESDSKAEQPRENPLTPADVCATVHHAVGITSDVSNSLGVSTGGKLIEGLF